MRTVDGRADLVGVFVEPSATECDQAASRYRLAAVQVHGRFDPNLVTDCSVPVIPVFNVDDGATASTLDWPPDTLVMLDGMPEPGALPGGTGHRVPLACAADVARHREILLAGGLGPDDVAQAIAAVRPAGVDASSRLERRPGEKDAELVRRFVIAARSAAAALAIDPR
jgi:phosphoribosylanthranilate isomerase